MTSLITSLIDHREATIERDCGGTADAIRAAVSGEAWLDEFAGWPLVALHHQVCIHYGNSAPEPYNVRGGIDLGRVSRPMSRMFPENTLAALPITPVWPGFVVDAAFFGSISWLIVAIPLGVRRALRRGQGACECCGYDRRGLDGAAVCPECGGLATTNSGVATPPGHGHAALTSSRAIDDVVRG